MAPSPRASRAGGRQGRPAGTPASARLPLGCLCLLLLSLKRPASPSSEPSGVEERAWGGRAGGGAGGKPGPGALSRPHPVTLLGPSQEGLGRPSEVPGLPPFPRVLSWEQGSIAGPETPDPQPGQPARQSRLSPPAPAGRATAQTLCPSKAVLLGPSPLHCCWHSWVALPHSSLPWEFPFCTKWGWPLARVRGDAWPGWHAGWHRGSEQSNQTCCGVQGQSWGFGQSSTCPPPSVPTGQPAARLPPAPPHGRRDEASCAEAPPPRSRLLGSWARALRWGVVGGPQAPEQGSLSPGSVGLWAPRSALCLHPHPSPWNRVKYVWLPPAWPSTLSSQHLQGRQAQPGSAQYPGA